MEVSFYQLLKTPLEKALPKLVEKIYQGGYRVLIVCESQERVEALNTVLWTFSPGAFVPHGYEGDPKHQPIWLTTELKNVNEATLVIITNGAYVESSEFEKCLDVFDGNDELSLKRARDRYTKYKNAGFPMAFWRQSETGAWETI
ncbi:DNA polymerase III subunit chi [Candidatus Paracaedibacter symbiosus]|uniref:DNA polymerase III subunit chi n=1 Tax=Candidatus Paracaedibacter symbiosus TaxID=244582 RepID=UPI00068B95D5|nr:DNA polymerase III subunit chi [Candidatus Paracaedibacter symbiosus]